MLDEDEVVVDGDCSDLREEDLEDSHSSRNPLSVRPFFTQPSQDPPSNPEVEDQRLHESAPADGEDDCNMSIEYEESEGRAMRQSFGDPTDKESRQN
jgi:hypothetical protein